MVSIFRTMGRAMQGKPLFDPSQEQQQDTPQPIVPITQQHITDPSQLSNGQQSAQSPVQPLQPVGQVVSQGPTIDRSNDRTFPVVRIKHTTTRLFGGQMEVRSHITNESPFRTEIDKISMLGTVTSPRYPLGPRQDKEFLIYKGPVIQNNTYRDMSIDYRADNGMCFKAIHDVRYQMNAGAFCVSEIDLRPPIHHTAG